jgi:hypothetical protein
MSEVTNPGAPFWSQIRALTAVFPVEIDLWVLANRIPNGAHGGPKEPNGIAT